MYRTNAAILNFQAIRGCSIYLVIMLRVDVCRGEKHLPPRSGGPRLDPLSASFSPCMSP